jgi:hypothetical protein
LSTYEINDFLAPGSNVQREGFGSFIQGNYLYHLYHRGSLTGPNYLPSGLLRVEIGTDNWTLTEFSQRIGFPKALAEFSPQGVAVFVDHDKEIAANQSSEGNWLGGYLYKLDLNAINQGLVQLTDSRLFWHDIKSEGDYRYAFAFDSNKLVAKLDMQGNILATTRLGRFMRLLHSPIWMLRKRYIFFMKMMRVFRAALGMEQKACFVRRYQMVSERRVSRRVFGRAQRVE